MIVRIDEARNEKLSTREPENAILRYLVFSQVLLRVRLGYGGMNGDNAAVADDDEGLLEDCKLSEACGVDDRAMNSERVVFHDGRRGYLPMVRNFKCCEQSRIEMKSTVLICKCEVQCLMVM